jgi:hypothetical protein
MFITFVGNALVTVVTLVIVTAIQCIEALLILAASVLVAIILLICLEMIFALSNYFLLKLKVMNFKCRELIKQYITTMPQYKTILYGVPHMLCFFIICCVLQISTIIVFGRDVSLWQPIYIGCFAIFPFALIGILNYYLMLVLNNAL